MASVTQHAEPSAPALRWEPTQFHHVTLDGHWWPESRNPGAELPDLVRAINQVHGPVVRLLLSASGWATRPHQIVVAGRTVSVGYFAERPPVLLTAICADGHTVALLVSPAGRPAAVEPDEDVWEGEGGRIEAPQRRS